MVSRRIDDHDSWAGEAPSREKPFPDGAKMKRYQSAEGGGRVLNYPDMDPLIKHVQDLSVDQVKKHPMAEGYRY